MRLINQTDCLAVLQNTDIFVATCKLDLRHTGLKNNMIHASHRRTDSLKRCHRIRGYSGIPIHKPFAGRRSDHRKLLICRKMHCRQRKKLLPLQSIIFQQYNRLACQLSRCLLIFRKIQTILLLLLLIKKSQTEQRAEMAF